MKRSSNKMKFASISLTLFAMQLLLGCGGTTKTQNKDFYTSGNREADERADQRMAQAQQLKGEGQRPSDAPLQSDTKKSLYERLGGQQGMEAISEDFVTRALADPRVNFARKDVKQGGISIHRGHPMEWDANPDNVKTLKIHFAQFLALASGGPSEYQGKQIKEAHQNMHISNDEFDASVGDLKATLDKMKIPNTEQKELLAIVETTRGEIVEER